MAHTIQNDRDLDLYAEACADDIIAEMGLSADEDDIQNSVHEYADGSEHVIYYYKAHAICQNCNTDSGEEFLADVGNPDPVTYDSLATTIAYGEIRARIKLAVDALLKELEQASELAALHAEVTA